MPRPIEALIHTDALVHNLARARQAAAGAKVWAVVKANAYGHGIAEVFEGLKGADGLALLDIAEAEQIRALGWRGPVLLLEGCFGPRDLDACSRLGLWHTVHHEAQIDMLAVHKTHTPHRVYLKMNSGMNRLGFAPQAYRAAWLRLDALPQVEALTLMTHLAGADGPGGADGVEPGQADAHGRMPLTLPPGMPADVAAQMAVFEAAVSELPGERSVCNSAATLRFAPHDAAIRGDWVRPGIALYGSAPDHPTRSAQDWQLEPAMTLRSALIAVQEVAAGASIGYGGHYRATRPMRIGVVACGYADGYPRVAPCGNEGGTPVLVDGERTRLVGRVSMDMITVDLGALPRARVGSEVTLWGRARNGAVLGIDEIAQAAGTVGYELMCARAPRVPLRVDSPLSAGESAATASADRSHSAASRGGR